AGKITPEEESKFKVAKEEEVDRETYWRRFGNCDNLQIFIWFMIGGIIIG
ncbi:4967_t:CDS:1, partial [Entrophospora sp. SA101]